MKRLEGTSRLTFLDGNRVKSLNRMLTRPDASIMPHVLAIQLGIDYPSGLAIIALLASEGLCRPRILIYHICEPDLPAGTVPLSFGLPQLPWRCPTCEEWVETYDALSFDVEAILLDSVELA